MRVHSFVSVILIMVLAGWASAGSEEPLVVHEWGTFTVLQDDRGNPVDGVNINEESLPSFVYKLASNLAPDSHELGPLIALGQSLSRRSKGISRSYHAARMRMETPIIYLYPPQDRPEQPVHVNVQFKGGWITEWYPKAQVVAPGYKRYTEKLMLGLTPTTTGTITWRGIKNVPGAKVPQTDFPVWLAPRKTAAPIVSTPDGEAEKYLFYRGVANLEAPLRVNRDGSTLSITINSNCTCPIEDYGNLHMWMVDVDPQGKLQYRRISTDLNRARSGQLLATTEASFDNKPGKGLTDLRNEMLLALIDRGLYRDEAEAMLNTWEASYFRTSGSRLFFTLPQSWTDKVLPLQVSGYEKTKIVRTMIGRIELISSRQRKLLNQIAAGPVSDRSWFVNWYKANDPTAESKVSDLSAGRATLKDLGMKPPADYQAYMELGRFRDALIQHEIVHPAQRAATQDHVKVDGTLIQIRHPAAARKVNSFTMTLPGENRIINLSEMEIYSGGKNVTAQAKLSQSSNYEGKFPIGNLVDGNKDCFSHTEPEKAPWIKVEFAESMVIDEVRIWNRGGFEYRFDGAQVAFFADEKHLASVEVCAGGSFNLRTFAQNYGLPQR